LRGSPHARQPYATTVCDVGALAWSHLRHLASDATFALFVVDYTQHALIAEYAAGCHAQQVTGTTMPLGQRVSGWVAANARTMTNADAALDLGVDQAGDLSSMIAVPLISDAVVVGVMAVYGPQPFDEDHARRLEMIAPHLATAVAGARAALTGVPPAMMVAELPPRASTREAVSIRSM
jgi:GAF domain-containing protein